MMPHRPSRFLLACTFAALFLLSACGRRQSEPTPTPDQGSDNQAEVQAAAAATVAFQRQVQTAIAQTVEADAPSEENAVATAAPAATETRVPATSTGTDSSGDIPTPTETPFQIVVVPVDGDAGNSNLHSRFTETRNGQTILLPDFEQYESASPPVFEDTIVFQIEVFDERVGTGNGAGIDRVEFEIRPSIGDEKGNGDPVYKQIEWQPGFCVFGGEESTCDVLTIGGRYDARWPKASGNERPIGGGRILNGNYRAIIDIFAQNGETTQWRWDFRIDNPTLDDLPDAVGTD